MTPEEIQSSPIIQFLIKGITKWQPFTSGFIKLDTFEFFKLYEVKGMKAIYDEEFYQTLLFVCETFLSQYHFELSILPPNELADGSRILLNFDLKPKLEEQEKLEDVEKAIEKIQLVENVKKEEINFII
jgi:hypothetical protein